MAQSALAQRIAAVRRFNRFYTQRIGVLEDGHMKSPFSLAEARVLYELAHRDKPTATALGKDLGLDAGYLSRILRGFHRRGLIGREASRADGRQSLLSLTERGAKAFAPLDTRTRAQIERMLGNLPAPKQERLVAAMHAVEGLLGAAPESQASFILRSHRPGDM